MRELLQQALKELREYRLFVEEDTKPTHLEQAIEAALSRSKWVKVADGLPVVPDGAGYIFIWAYSTSKTIHRIQYSDLRNACLLHVLYSHWMYCADDTPAPPEDA